MTIFSPSLRCYQWLPAAVVLLALAVNTQAQQPAPEQFRVYELRRAKAAEVEPLVDQVLSGLSERTEVVADNKANRLLVRGSAEAQRLAQELIGSLDQAFDPATRPAAEPEPVLKVYPVADARAADVAARLQAQFPAHPGVRIVADERTSQVLVLAPPGVQAQVAEQLGQRPGIQGGAQAVKEQSREPKENVVRVPVQLSRLSPDAFESSLSQLWGSRFRKARDAGDENAWYRVVFATGLELELHFNRRSGQVLIQGPAQAAQAARSCAHLLEALDKPPERPEQAMRVVSVSRPASAGVREALDAVQASGEGEPAGLAAQRSRGVGAAMVARLFRRKAQVAEDGRAQPQPASEAAAQPEPMPGQAQPEGEQMPPEGAEQAPEGDEGVLGQVQIEYLEDLDTIIIRGNQRDVERVMQLIEEIERLAVETQPVIDIVDLQHVGSVAMAETIRPLYDEVLLPRQGRVSITALVKPNALLLIGREESVQTVRDLVSRLDQPVGPAGQFRVFRLRHQPAAIAATTITQFFAERTALGTRVQVTPDVRTNSLIVQASPRDLIEVARLLKNIDTPTSEAVNELRVFKLSNSLAEELAPILQEAVNAQAGQFGAAGAFPAGAQPGAQFAPGAPGAQPGAVPGQAALGQQKSMMLRFMTIDAEGLRQVTSGILADVRITADPRANSLLVSAPADSMELLGALIEQLDQQPAALAQIKVFTIVNGDAATLVEMLEALFGAAAGAARGAAQLGPQPLVSGGEGSLLPLRFSVDPRTNSIIASGSAGDLAVVEAILLRLDESDVRQRRSTVYRLKNSPAEDVAISINDFLRSERQVQQAAPGLVSPFEQIEREVIVVPEIVSNSLIISATPRFYEEIVRLVEQLDARPPMVMIQVLIAEVTLNNTDEFGVELGLQDSVLFDRSLLSEVQFQTISTQQAVPGGGTITTQTENVLAANNVPGFLFNNLALGNSGSSRSLSDSDIVGGQGLSNFALGRTNPELGFGGLVLSASSESVSLLIRALKESRRLEVLSRPQIMTLDNQPAFIQVGQRVPRITESTLTEVGQTNATTLENVGLLMGVTPRISPDGLVVMELDAEKSQLGPEAEGIPVSVSVGGTIIRSPRIDTTLAQTTISAANGQTVVFAGLITKSDAQFRRRVPILSEIPLLGNLFRYDGVSTRKTELLIIMTPHIIRNVGDAESVKQAEAARMSWCLADVRELHGDGQLRGHGDDWSDAEVMTLYPDTPLPSEHPIEELPVPAQMGPELVPGDRHPLPAPQMIEPVPAMPAPDRPAPEGFLPPSGLRHGGDDAERRATLAPEGFLPPSELRPAAPGEARNQLRIRQAGRGAPLPRSNHETGVYEPPGRGVERTSYER